MILMVKDLIAVRPASSTATDDSHPRPGLPATVPSPTRTCARVKRSIREGRRFDLLLNPTEKDLRRKFSPCGPEAEHRRKFARYYLEPTGDVLLTLLSPRPGLRRRGEALID